MSDAGIRNATVARARHFLDESAKRLHDAVDALVLL